MHEYHPYPKWKYHAEKEATVVSSAEAESALGTGWVDSPADVADAQADQAAVIEQIEEILHHVPKRKKTKS